MKSVFAFFSQVHTELQKVTWPKYDELVGSTVIVLVFVSIFAVILGGMDSAVALGIKQLFTSMGRG